MVVTKQVILWPIAGILVLFISGLVWTLAPQTAQQTRAPHTNHSDAMQEHPDVAVMFMVANHRHFNEEHEGLKHVLTIISGFLRLPKPSKTIFGLVHYGERPFQLQPGTAQELDAQLPAIEPGHQSIPRPYRAFDHAISELGAMAPHPSTRRYLIVISDGMDNFDCFFSPKGDMRFIERKTRDMAPTLKAADAELLTMAYTPLSGMSERRWFKILKGLATEVDGAHTEFVDEVELSGGLMKLHDRIYGPH